MNELAIFAGGHMKTCSKCKAELPLASFYRRGDAFRAECKACARAMTVDWYSRNSEYAKGKVRAWADANADRVRAYRAANRRKSYLQEAKRKYGIAPADFETLMSSQNGCCATCAKPFDWGDKQTKPHIDHCHQNGKVRGILCNRCNTVLGLVADDGALLSRLAGYLE